MNKSGLCVKVLAFLGAALFSNNAVAERVDILVPAYTNPCCSGGTTMWPSLIAIADDPLLDVDVYVIFNPASGPGTAVDPNYVDTSGNGPLPDVRNAGAKVFGYVPTSFSARAIADVKGDVDKYYDTLYPGLIDGIFFDEMSNNLGDVSYHQELRDYVKAKSAGAVVIGNPGTTFTNGTGDVNDYILSMDILVIFENTGSEYENNYTSQAWQKNYDASRFAHIVHTKSTWDNTYLDLLASRNAGLIYVTDDVMINPYDTLPSYWDTEVAAISTYNTCMPPQHCSRGAASGWRVKILQPGP